jgi:hypothetical protein
MRISTIPGILSRSSRSGTDPEAAMLRSVLENFGATVLLHLPDTPGDILDVLDRPGSEPSLLIVCGHGDEEGLVVGEMGEGRGIDTSMLVGKDRLPPQAIAERVHLPGWTVLSTGCLTGNSAMADVFRKGGVAALIGPEDYPEGTATALFAIHLLYELIVRKRSVEDAWRRAASYDEQSRMFVLHTPADTLRVASPPT